jgi:hypothetical protein
LAQFLGASGTYDDLENFSFSPCHFHSEYVENSLFFILLPKNKENNIIIIIDVNFLLLLINDLQGFFLVVDRETKKSSRISTSVPPIGMVTIPIIFARFYRPHTCLEPLVWEAGGGIKIAPK